MEAFQVVVIHVVQLGQVFQLRDCRQVVVLVLQFGCNKKAGQCNQLQPKVHDGVPIHEMVHEQHRQMPCGVSNWETFTNVIDKINDMNPIIQKDANIYLKIMIFGIFFLWYIPYV